MEEKRIYTDNESGSEIEVTFDDLQYQWLSSVDHSNIYECRGTDSEGNIYSGIAEFCCGELVDIEEITFEEPYFHKDLKRLYDATKDSRDFYNKEYPELKNMSEQEKMAFYKSLK